LLSLNQLADISQEQDLESVVCRRLAREPVSRILGTRDFWKSCFKLGKDTLDPRPDSETLIETALKYVPQGAHRVLDLGTGTGCLLLSLLQEWPAASGVGVDISEGATEIAKENAQDLGLDHRARFVTGHWESFQTDSPFDVLISNPPYITEAEIKTLAPEVAQYDPLRALSGGKDGLDCYRSIIKTAKNWLKPGGWLFFEIGHRQGKTVKDLLEQGGFHVLQTVPDLAGNDRCTVARIP
jgi:release factor glutamine methyltransferase